MDVPVDVPVDTAPLSPGQERLWWLQRFDPGDASYNIFVTERLRGPLDTDALGRALDEVVARHGALRTRFHGDVLPVQQVPAPGRCDVEHLDLTHLAAAERERRARELVAERTNRPFDLAAAPPLRMSLLRLAEQEHVFCLVVHHIVADGWSLGVLYRELAALYQAYRAGEPSPLRPPRLQYTDHVRGLPEPDPGDLAYWAERLAGLPPLEPPADRPRPPVRAGRGDVHVLRMPPEVAAGVEQVARAHRCTPFMTMLAAYQVLLARHTGQDRFAVGSAISGRTEPELEDLVGYFAGTLVLRADLTGDPAFADLLRRVRKDALGAFAHRSVPFERLLDELAVPRDRSRTPLFQTMFVQQNQAEAGQGRLSLAGLEVEPFEPGFRHAKTDLIVDVTRDAGGLLVAFTYDTALFDATTVARLARRYETVLRAVAADPGTPVSAIEVMPAGERAKLLRAGTGPAPAAPPAGLPELFAAQVARTPHAAAVTDAAGTLTYAELAGRARRLAGRLRAAGAGRGSLVGVYLDRSAGMVAALLGVLEAGAAYVPLDPAFPPARLAHVLADCGAAHVVTRAGLAGGLPPGAYTIVPADPDGAADRPDPVAAGDPPENAGEGARDTGGPDGTGAAGGMDGEPAGPDHPAYVIYTSGSTGAPKGVVVPHGALAAFLHGMRELLDPRPEHVWCAATSISFDISALEMYLPLVTGGQVVVARGAEDIAALTRPGGGAPPVTHVQATPSGWRVVLAGDFDGRVVTALAGGEALPGPLAEELRPRVARLVNMYGPTETTIWSTAWEVPARPEEVCIGRPIAGTTVYVCDDRGDLVPPGVPGELLIGGAGVATGYHGRPALTAGRFVPDPAGPPGARRYRAGDRVRWRPDGTLAFLGRLDDQMKVRGHRVEPGEIEACLLRHPAAGRAAVTVRDDTLLAYVVPAAGAAPAPAEELRAHCRDTLPAYMVPNLVVTLDALPMTPNGKIDRAALPVPRREAAGGYVAPRTDAESLVTEVWAEVLGLDAVGAEDDFFAIGGHSLHAVRVVSRLRAIVEVDVPIRTLFARPTAASLAAAVEELLVAEMDRLSDEEAERLLGPAAEPR
ncbi:hypothetical protein Sru01_34870 [Sphaerisporangium rufum]|uniref:Carrier domain-containing protein n=1 Tax=Sphaerisporangium rufum TaxID=1381558 RepID=A0A919R558_9ACTN|nr:non-ribosomal peptide synthetase [Sphaerisporangium rufum]GII78505.1 hypothetical protein Sru01_34870 [Sphaerisporangium rufum]